MGFLTELAHAGMYSEGRKFPSPLEVTGGSNNMALTDTKILGAFPSPPEVTGVSNEFAAIVTTEGVVFPYPLEVNEGF